MASTILTPQRKPPKLQRSLATAAILTLALLLAVATSSFAQSSSKVSGPYPDAYMEWGLPGSPTGQRLGSLLNLLREKDTEAARQYVSEVLDDGFRESSGADSLVAFLESMFETIDGFTLDDIDRQPGGDAHAVLGTPDGKATLLVIAVAEAAPHLVQGLTFRPYDQQVDAVPPIESIEAADRYLQELADADKYGGVLAIMVHDEVVFTKGYGLARLETEDEPAVGADPTILFNVGSITKDFTRVAVLKLVSQGKLRLDDTVGQHLNGFKPEVADHVTVKHLLDFTSGLGDYHQHPDFRVSLAEPTRLERVIDMIRDSDLAFEPGTREMYSNSGYAVLGAIVQAASGVDYYRYVESEVFAPAQMRNSRFLERDDPRVAIGYTRMGSGELESNRAYLPLKGTPAGSSYSTVGDLLRFQQALHSDLFGIGGDKERFGCFAGGGPGVNAVRCAHESGLTLAMVSNVDEGIAEKVGVQLFRTLRDQ